MAWVAAFFLLQGVLLVAGARQLPQAAAPLAQPLAAHYVLVADWSVLSLDDPSSATSTGTLTLHEVDPYAYQLAAKPLRQGAYVAVNDMTTSPSFYTTANDNSTWLGSPNAAMHAGPERHGGKEGRWMMGSPASAPGPDGELEDGEDGFAGEGPMPGRKEGHKGHKMGVPAMAPMHGEWMAGEGERHGERRGAHEEGRKDGEHKEGRDEGKHKEGEHHHKEPVVTLLAITGAPAVTSNGNATSLAFPVALIDAGAPPAVTPTPPYSSYAETGGAGALRVHATSLPMAPAGAPMMAPLPKRFFKRTTLFIN